MSKKLIILVCYWVHCMNKDTEQYYQRLSVTKHEKEIVSFILLCNDRTHLPQSVSKR